MNLDYSRKRGASRAWECPRSPGARGLIREDLYCDLDEIRTFAERGLRALEVENDLDLGRALDQWVKHFRAVAANLKALVLVKSGAPL